MKKGLKTVLLNTLLFSVATTSLAIPGMPIIRNAIISNKQYLKPHSQIERDAEFLDANMDIMNFYVQNMDTNEVLRLKHNGDEPIYVSTDKIKDEFLIENINKSLEYVEDVFSEINDKYKFEIVNKEKLALKKALGKTVIEYDTFENESESLTFFYLQGYNTSTNNKTVYDDLFNNSSTNIYNVESVININEKLLLDEYKEDILSVLIHELLHSFGLGDIYSTDLCELTFMDTNYGIFSKVLAPNDMRALYSAYYEGHLNENGEIDYEKLQEVKDKLDTYELEYYNYIAKMTIKNKELSNIVDMEPINKMFAAKLINGKTYLFDIKNDKVSISIFDRDKNFEKTIESEILYGKNYAIIKGVDEESSEDLVKLHFAIYKNNEGKYTFVRLDGQTKLAVKSDSKYLDNFIK